MVHEEAAAAPAEPKGPRERRRDANHRRILSIAMRMVEAGGLEALSVNKLAEAADYTPGALYRYFPSKDALLAALVGECLSDVCRFLAAADAVLPARASPLARVFVLARGYRAFARARAERFALLAMTLAHPRVLLPEQGDAEPVMGGMIAALEPLARALGAAAAAGLLDEGDVAERTISLFALLQGVLQLHKQSRLAPGILDLERLATRGIRALLVGWGAKSRTVDAAIERATGAPDFDVPA